MATYKLIQDVEAEDKILGPLSLRQFIFGMLAAFSGYLCYFVVAKGAPFLLIVFLPPTLFMAFFAFPFGRDQPTETWALAKLNFYLKPRKRIWNQSGVKELVTITAPKKVERVLTNGLSQNEVQSRLKALADTIDSRGWAVKNVNLNSFAMPIPAPQSTDRLVDPNTIPRSVPETDINAADDMFDMKHSPIAQQFDNMMDQYGQTYRAQVQQRMQSPGMQQNSKPTNDYWFMNSGGSNSPQITSPQAQTIDPAQDKELSEKIKNQAHSTPAAMTNLRTLKRPVSAKSSGSKNGTIINAQTPVPPVTAPADPAILTLADNNDLNVATLAREAKRVKGDDEPKDEVVVPLR